MQNSKTENFGIFFIDASFDYKTKSGVVGAKEVIKNKVFRDTIQAKHPTDAEYKGIKKLVFWAYSKGYNNIIIFGDNKKAIEVANENLRDDENIKIMFHYIQFVWIKRGFNNIADYLSKNIDKKTAEELENQRNNIFVNTITKRNIDEVLKSFYILKSEYKKTYNSSIFNNNTISVDELVLNAITELKMIEDDIENENNTVLKSLMMEILNFIKRG
jgi:hypothetical protein